MYKVCLDYGHGGNDPGAKYKGRKESDDNLYIGREIAKELRRHGIKVGETRTSDTTVSLNKRSSFSNKGNYDYFISIHRNAFKPEVASGVETYIFNRASKESKELAAKIQNALTDIGFINRGVNTANFHVLRETKAPAVLIEIGFLDNKNDNYLFDSRREEITTGITKAILDQLGITYVEEDKELIDAVNILVDKNIINSPQYWIDNARKDKTVKGEYAAILIKRIALLSNT
ncbi:N-acetylmuramoyl-L-alanine amidase [Candidatus Syntrophocurvum alkaliphilum]|uniref:N-acetylmuramoyl-L-alanine amidase n=1 Tax=Candidatus Syntrophocurvum alkaliphilum TaxID=2293317 RepID=A0A6I6DGG7_9FIRM|nr:N-acetylmuramoyl-L-alanine amidase [Candidatus Syntrophocurvum alkaliphilum]QGT99490.1 N-acetylmuramoyl-L-alanine amidase [Candidatus Syntrophocurvum alkaliphilum]